MESVTHHAQILSFELASVEVTALICLQMLYFEMIIVEVKQSVIFLLVAGSKWSCWALPSWTCLQVYIPFFNAQCPFKLQLIVTINLQKYHYTTNICSALSMFLMPLKIQKHFEGRCCISIMYCIFYGYIMLLFFCYKGMCSDTILKCLIKTLLLFKF